MHAVTRRPQRLAMSRLVVAILVAGLVAAIVAIASPSPVLGATTISAACDGVNLRTKPSTSGTIKASIKAGTTAGAVSTVSGSSWKAVCGGKTVSGSSWYKISVVGGRSASSRYGVSYVYAATGLFKVTSSVAGATSTVSTTMAAACDGVNLRTSASTSATRRTSLAANTRVTVVATVSGSSWRATCGGSEVSGSKWYRISAIGGKSVKSLYGVSYLYTATGLLKAAATSMATACDGVNVRTSASTKATVKASLSADTRVGVSATVTGSSWSAVCNGKTSTASSWYRISSINGKSVSSLHGVSYLYAATSLFKAPSAAPRLTEGIDVSHWQGSIDWAKVAAAGKRFVYIKASEHTTFVDSRYATNRAGAKGAGLLVGAYHFARPDGGHGDAVAEADHFVATARIAKGDLLPVLDLEVTGGLSTTALQGWTRSFLERVYQKTGQKAVIYTAPSFWKSEMGDSRWFADNGYQVLWIAHWTTASAPSVPANGWGSKGWTFWQYSDRGTVPGISGPVDLNRYNGSDFSRVIVK